jgi:hypothetical protein
MNLMHQSNCLANEYLGKTRFVKQCLRMDEFAVNVNYIENEYSIVEEYMSLYYETLREFIRSNT